MSPLTRALLSTPVFEHADPEELERHRHLWARVRLGSRDQYWREGQPGYGLTVQLSGELRGYSGDKEVFRTGPGDLLGAASGHLPLLARSNTLLCARRARLLAISPRGLAQLQAVGSSLYPQLLRHSLFTVGGRLRRALVELDALVQPDPDVVTPSHRSVGRGLRSVLRLGARIQRCPELHPLLRSLPGMMRAHPTVVDQLASCFLPLRVREGDVLMGERDCEAELFLLGCGPIEVSRMLPSMGRTRVTTVGPGELLGSATRFTGGRRLSTAVALTDGWAWRLDPERMLDTTPSVRLCLLRAQLAVLGVRARAAHMRLAALTEDMRSDAQASLGERLSGMSDDHFFDMLQETGFISSSASRRRASAEG